MSSDPDNTETVQVKTRVPKYQREEWKAAANRLGMSQSEFLRSMVQAGRSGFESSESAGQTSNPEEADSSDATPGGDALENRVVSMLSSDEAVSWDEFVEVLVGDFKERLEETLQSADRVHYSGREGGYVLTDGE